MDVEIMESQGFAERIGTKAMFLTILHKIHCNWLLPVSKAKVA